jgi:lysophospholipase L1-like esterase
MDSMKERIFVPALHGFIDTLRERHPDLPVLVVSPIFCPVAEDHPGPTIPTRDGRYRVIDGPDALRLGALTLQRVRTLIAELVAARRADGDAHLHALDGTELFAEADWAAGDMPDDLHPNPAGYRRMGERFAAHAFGPDGAFHPR